MNTIRDIAHVYKQIQAQKPFLCRTCRNQDFVLAGKLYYNAQSTGISLFCQHCDCSTLYLDMDGYSYVTHTYVEQGRWVCVYTFYNCDLSKNPDYFFDDDDDGKGMYYVHAIRQEPPLFFKQ